jgi:hypothetical protein
MLNCLTFVVCTNVTGVVAWLPTLLAEPRWAALRRDDAPATLVATDAARKPTASTAANAIHDLRRIRATFILLGT